jgi:carboxypeptidase Q
LKDEVVILGGHLDCWHSATDAADNAAADMMEAVRLTETNEGSAAQRITLETREACQLAAAKAKISAYYNIDNGPGKIRGVYLRENDKVKLIFEEWLSPFA